MPEMIAGWQTQGPTASEDQEGLSGGSTQEEGKANPFLLPEEENAGDSCIMKNKFQVVPNIHFPASLCVPNHVSEITDKSPWYLNRYT